MSLSALERWLAKQRVAYHKHAGYAEHPVAVKDHAKHFSTVSPSTSSQTPKAPNFKYVTGIKGPNGNLFISHQWISTSGERYSQYEGGLVNARVSDWDNAETCAICKRHIVHTFWVKDARTGDVKPYGVEHIHTALGFSKPLAKKQIDALMAELERKQEYEKAETDILLKRATNAKTVAEANNRYFKVNTNVKPEQTSLWVSPKGEYLRIFDSPEQNTLAEKLGFNQAKTTSSAISDNLDETTSRFLRDTVPRAGVKQDDVLALARLVAEIDNLPKIGVAQLAEAVQYLHEGGLDAVQRELSSTRLAPNMEQSRKGQLERIRQLLAAQQQEKKNA